MGCLTGAYNMDNSVVIVEDECIIAEDLRGRLIVLENSRYRVSGVVESAEEAEALIELDEPGIFLLDINLKGH